MICPAFSSETSISTRILGVSSNKTVIGIVYRAGKELNV
jgi:hypothetical protein